MTLQQMADAQQPDHRVEIRRRAAAAANEPASVQEVAPYAEMRKQPAVLEHVADAPSMRGHEDAAFGIDQGLPVDRDPAAIRTDQPAHDVDQAGLAGARAAEQRRQSRRRREAGLQPEGAAPVVYVDVEAHAVCRRAPMRRASSSDPSSASMEMAIDTRVSRIAAASPPGTCVSV